MPEKIIDSNTVNDNNGIVNQTLDALADAVNAWCDERHLRPANGQAATELSVRTLRYYRTVNLLDAPLAGGGLGYGPRHFLQACAVRVLQAQGLPLSRIQALLFGRSDDELQSVLDSVDGGGAPSLPEPSAFPTQGETWRTWPLTPDLMLVSRRQGLSLSAAQLDAIKQILRG